MAVVATGEVTQEDRMDYGSGRRYEWFELAGTEDFCFLMPSYSGNWGYGDEAAMVVIDRRERLRLALVESTIGNIKISLETFETIQCPR